MRAVVWRELLVIVRRPAYTAAICTYVAAIGLFVAVWNRGVPVEMSSIYEQQRWLQRGLLGLWLPWVAARCLAWEYGDRLARLAALTALRPVTILGGRVLAATMALTLVAIAPTPVVLLARQLSAAPLGLVVRDIAMAPAFSLLAAAAVVGVAGANDDRLVTWMLAAVMASVVAVLEAWLSPEWLPAGWLVATSGLAVAGVAVVWTAGHARGAGGGADA